MPRINIENYPQLAALCWSSALRSVEESEALQLYESGWRFIEQDHLVPAEKALIDMLVDRYGNGVLNV